MSGDRFGERFARVGFLEKRLTLKIRELDEVAINDSEAAESGANEEIGRDGAERSAADENSARLEKALLAFFADAGKKNLARIFLELPGVHDSLE